MELEVWVVLIVTFDTSVNVNAFGVVSAASVVLVYVSVMPPTFKVVFTAVLKLLEDVCRTVKVSPFTAVPAEDVYEPPFLLYVPPVIETATVVSIPEIVIWLEVCVVLLATFVTSVNVNAFGEPSAAVRVTVNVSFVAKNVCPSPPVETALFVKSS
jgi:hypothetical protein